MKGILGKKLGMTSIYGELGGQIAVTVLDINGNVVVGKRTVARDGYSALIVGFGSQKVHRLNKAERGFLVKQGLVNAEAEETSSTVRQLREFRMSEEALKAFKVGQELKAVDFFNVGERVDVAGTSKGRGFTGVMKRHNFAGSKATHGVHEYFRHGGAIGAGAYPSRVIKGLKMAGRMGNERVTTRNLQVVRTDSERNLLYLRGSVPGHNNGLVRVRAAVARRA